jgi:hypothetical protein
MAAFTGQRLDRSGRTLKFTLPNTVFFVPAGVITVFEFMVAKNMAPKSSALGSYLEVRHAQLKIAIQTSTDGLSCGSST